MAPRRYRMDQRRAAAAETRRRILMATMALPAEQGVLATSWEDIARRADVAVATVYRHFPTLDTLVHACAELTFAAIRPPAREDAATLFAGAPSLGERVERLVEALCAFYARGAASLETVRRERHQVAGLAEAQRSFDTVRQALVHQALLPAQPAAQTLRLVCGLTEFAVWQALVSSGVDQEVLPEVMRQAILCCVNHAADDRTPPPATAG